ncbi:MAG: bifunctional serine/threonine-protein kinase/formylglycine-generating enzyme family protein [Planctomycetota bacterium]
MHEPPTLTPDALEERAAVAFLESFVADALTGVTRPLAHYLAPFAPFEQRIVREWLHLTGAATATPTAAPPPTPDAEHIGPYRLLAELGRGGQGIVYLADDTRLARQVALKVLARDVAALSGPSLLRLQREAEAVARLDHPGIATIYETGRSDGVAWIAMRHVPGGSVQQRIARRVADGLGPPQRPAEITAVVRLVERAARALAAAHLAGIQHRDIKPANLLLADDGQPVLVDFGLAAVERGSTPTITLPGAVFGTLVYAAPERLAGAETDVRADVYSLGVVLFELLALRRPFAADVMTHELKEIAEGATPDVRRWNPAVSSDLAVVVATALAREPSDRYASAAAFADDLARVLANETIAARPASAALRLRRWTQRNPALARSLAALALVLVAGLAATTWAWRSAARALADVRRLADLKQARELIERAAELWPARPERLLAMRAWHDELEVLRARLPAHRRRQAELALAGRQRSPASAPALQRMEPGATAERWPAGRQGSPANAPPLQRMEPGSTAESWPAGDGQATAWESEQLSVLLAEHTRLDALRTGVEQRMATAADLERRTLAEPRAAWDAAVARIAAHPLYGGLHLTPQLGLVPLGPDPASGLEEFGHVLSGTLPRRNPANGALELDDDSGLVLVLVPGGRSVLGADATLPGDGRPANLDPETPPEQSPSYVVDLAPYFLSRCEMTQAQWLRHTGDNPSTYRVGAHLTKIDSLLHPVELVSWNDCDRVLRELDLCIPSEAQWEHAYRAGTHAPYPYGTDAHSLAGHENLADVTARERGTNHRLRFIDWLDDGWFVHAPVGSFAANAWGFHDMGGNVKEWCDDSWEDYGAAAPRAGDGRRRGQFDQYRIVRGGSFSSYIDDARAAARAGVERGASGPEAGVRPARRIE